MVIAVSNYLLQLKSIPIVSIALILVELLILTMGAFAWYWFVWKHPIQAHVRLMRNAGKPWVIRGARILQNEDGTRSLKLIGVKKAIPCPDLKFVHSNATFAFFRKMRVYLVQDGVEDYHPLAIEEFGEAFKPETQDMKFFYANMNRQNDSLFTEKQAWWKANFGIIAGLMSFAIAGLVLILVVKYHNDFVSGAAGQLASASNNLASAITSVKIGG